MGLESAFGFWGDALMVQNRVFVLPFDSRVTARADGGIYADAPFVSCKMPNLLPGTS